MIVPPFVSPLAGGIHLNLLQGVSVGLEGNYHAFLNYILLGVLQGFTEFLPVSSSGHLVLLQNLVNFNPSGVVTEVALHLATLFAVVIYYFRDFSSIVLLKPSASLEKPKAYILGLAVVTSVTTIGVYPFRGYLASVTEDSLALMRVGIAFIVTSVILLATDAFLRRQSIRIKEAGALSLLPLVVIGLAQAISALPGISRSGTTIFAGVLCGLSREESARFSFFMYVPIALIASVYEAYVELSSLTFPSELVLPLLLGFISALLTGILAISILLKVLRRARLAYFSAYLILAGIISLLLQ